MLELSSNFPIFGLFFIVLLFKYPIKMVAFLMSFVFLLVEIYSAIFFFDIYMILHKYFEYYNLINNYLYLYDYVNHIYLLLLFALNYILIYVFLMICYKIIYECFMIFFDTIDNIFCLLHLIGEL